MERMLSLYRCVEASEPINMMKTNNRDKSNQTQEIRGSRACRHASLYCVDQHLVVWWLRSVAQTSSSRRTP